MEGKASVSVQVAGVQGECEGMDKGGGGMWLQGIINQLASL